VALTVTDINKGKGQAGEAIFAAQNSAGKLMGQEEGDSFWENFNVISPTKSSTTGEFREFTDTTYLATKANTKVKPVFSNRDNGFTRADTLRGKLTPLRTCYDVTFYDLDVKVDIDNKSISGSNMMRFKVTEPFRKMQVDLYANMQIHKILYGQKELPYTREFNAVFIDFPETMQPGGKEQEITIHYSGRPKEPNLEIPMDGGFLWEKDREGNPWVQVVCQGSGASLWWPNKDHLSDEPDSVRIAVTVPKGLMNISNGRLRKTTELSGNLTKYEWYVSYPINNYNVTLNIGKYAHWQDTYVTTDTLTIDYYAMPYNLQKAKQMFIGVKPMLACLESNYGKYPFARDGFKLMESLHAMEHQSAVTFGKIPEGELPQDSTNSPISLIWHEVSHEWWGNNVSCKDVADMWIHEAFAVYSERLPLKNSFGKEGETAYISGLPEQVAGKEPIIGVYDVNHIHYDIEDMYSKAALMLHTFSNVLNNDKLWADIIKGIQKDFQYKTVTTENIVTYINTKTKTDYTYFFDQYLKHTAIPTLSVKYGVKGELLTLSYKWIADVPGFRMPVKVTKTKGKYEFIYPTTTWQTITLPGMEPDDFEVDENNFYVNVEEIEE
jgi:aminopeptidase N